MADDGASDEVQLLKQLGVDDDELGRAVDRGADALASMVAAHVAFPGPRTLTAREVWEAADVSEDAARQLWRAMGFPQAPDDAKTFTEADVEALTLTSHLVEKAGITREVALQQARAMSQALARIADAQQDVVSDWAAFDDQGSAVLAAANVVDEILPTLDKLLVYLYRRHLAAATERNALMRAAGPNDLALTVGFADLVGFTALSQHLDERQLARLVDEFSAVAADVVVEGGARVVKMIGDEVMFSGTDAVSAARIALELIDRFSGDNDRPTLRAGLASGPVLARDGDLFGPTVNLASRLVNIAQPATVLIDDAVCAALADQADLVVKDLRPQRLKGIGSTRLHVLRRAG